MSADDGSSESAGAGKSDHCQCKNRRRVGDNNNDDDDKLYAAALRSTITKTPMGRPPKSTTGPKFAKLPTTPDSTLTLPRASVRKDYMTLITTSTLRRIEHNIHFAKRSVQGNIALALPNCFLQSLRSSILASALLSALALCLSTHRITFPRL